MRSMGGLVLLAVYAGSLRAGDVVINEVHYDPKDNTIHEGFIELTNTGAEPVDISGWFFSSGIEFTFPAKTSIAPGGFMVVAEDPDTLMGRYPLAEALGPYGGTLSNSGERLVLRDAEGLVEDEVDYGVGFPWPLGSAGEGSSMELINPLLDNDLGGSWRASGQLVQGAPERIYFIEQEDAAWHWRKGTSEASSPIDAWRQRAFVEDASWQVGQTSIGYGDGDDKTDLTADMPGKYTSIYLRHTFTIAAGQVPGSLMLGLYVDDGAVAWINGHEVKRLHVTEGVIPKFNGSANASVEAAWQDFLLEDPHSYLVEGLNVLAIHALNQTATSSDFSIDARLFVPGPGDVGGATSSPPTPGKRNSVYADNAPPQIRQVQHLIAQPVEWQDNLITAKVTDPDGVQSVRLSYQVVQPGSYIPAFLPVPLAALMADAEQPPPANPDFESPSNWTTLAMVDDGTGADQKAGDGIYSAAILGEENRTLIRYRITAVDTKGASVRVPYADDPSLDFAYFIYNGVPDYQAATSITGRPTVYPAEDLTSVAVYFLITRKQDLLQAIAASAGDQIPQGNNARFTENWEGAFIYEGVVHDHMRYRLRGANGRYQIPPTNPANIPGKRHWHFRFNKGSYLQARDRFGKLLPTRWQVLNSDRLFGNRLDGNWGLGDQVNDIVWTANGVPSPYGHVFHWRVILGAEEAPAGANGQYLGDFWGMARAFENYDVRFLEARDMPKGNLYKLVNQTDNALDQERYQAPYAVADGGDHNNVENNLLPSKPDAWLLAYVNYDEWYRYHAVAQAIRHYDYWADANKNAAWYFEPVYLPENSYFGRMWSLPFDHDATWGPTWNAGIDRPYDAIYGVPGKPEFQKAYRNAIRHVRDLLWQPDQLHQVIRQTASFMVPLQNADIDRWRNAPAESGGRQYFSNPPEASLDGKAADMIKFAFTGGSWPGGDVGAGGRAAFLDSFADGPDAGKLPQKPTISYMGPAGFPMDGLKFRSSDFSDPQGASTFKAVKWRIARVTPMANPGSIPLTDPIWKVEPIALELTTLWESDDLVSNDPITIPMNVIEEGRTYRVRARMEDTTSLWGHWSSPIEFTAGAPAGPVPEVEGLRITEIMYNPIGGSDYEFIELQNTSAAATLSLLNVSFRAGIEFAFRDGAVTSLGPGEYVLIVANLALFSQRYETAGLKIAGEYSGNLNNGGERLVLTFGSSLDILDFTYQDDWYPPTDGGGYSLNLRDTGLPAAAMSDPSSWYPASVLHGTPGAPDPGLGAGFVHPGDANLDGRVDLGDALSLLFRLFLGEPAAPPCALALLDANGDDQLDLSDVIYQLRYLFQGGPAHALGESCKPFGGCPQACGN